MHFGLWRGIGLGTAAILLGTAATPVHADGKPGKPYAGQEQRAIKSLSPADIETLRKGGGWGFAKAAELNGYPGPLHVLELAGKLNLTADQKSRIRQVYARMRADAVRLGGRLIAQERRLDTLFASRKITPELLTRTTAQIGRTRAALRAVHLRAHLETPTILTRTQIARYNRLRGYGAKAGRHHPNRSGHHGHKP